MTIQLGYCTNVHAGADLEQTLANLHRYALDVKQRVSPHAPLGIGLWLSAVAARELRDERRLDAFQAWLAQAGLSPFTFNGFPYGDFHQTVVKRAVYRPDWSEPARLDYTRDLIAIQDRLLPAGLTGSISTLPVRWGALDADLDALEAAAQNLAEIAEHLARLHRDTGRRIWLCLEPEPGCVLQRSGDVVRFFERHLLPGRDERTLREHVRVCHDVCHAAVMFEDQAEAIDRYRSAGIRVGKVQASSAVAAPWDRLAGADRLRAIAQLRTFDEPRYLHQTCVRPSEDAAAVLFEDLPQALESRAANTERGQWRVHFHVPIFVQRIELLETTQADLAACWRATRACSELTHWEIETYAWDVLPRTLRPTTLAEGIAAEFRWFQSEIVGQEAAQSSSQPRAAR